MPKNLTLIHRLSMERLRALVVDMECMCCGAMTPKPDLHTHHINLDRTDDRIRNLSIICRECHTAAHQTAEHGWRRSITPIASLLPPKKNKLKRTWEDRFNERHLDVGGVEGFKNMYFDDNLALADIGIKMGVCRERVRQYAVRLALPPRMRGFKKRQPRYGFPYRHKPLSDWLQGKGMNIESAARLFNLSYNVINHYLGCVRPIPTGRAQEMSLLTGGELTCEQLINPNGSHQVVNA